MIYLFSNMVYLQIFTIAIRMWRTTQKIIADFLFKVNRVQTLFNITLQFHRVLCSMTLKSYLLSLHIWIIIQSIQKIFMCDVCLRMNTLECFFDLARRSVFHQITFWRKKNTMAFVQRKFIFQKTWRMSIRILNITNWNFEYKTDLAPFADLDSSDP